MRERLERKEEGRKREHTAERERKDRREYKSTPHILQTSWPTYMPIQ